MKFTKLPQRFLVLAASVTITACQWVVDQPMTEIGTEAAVADSITVNPYLLNRPSVPSTAVKRFRQANEAIQEENWSQAEFELLWLNDNYPALSGPYLSLASVYQSTGALDKAETAFKQAIAANKTNVNAYNQYGIYWRQQGQFALAEQQYKQALTVWPDYPDAHINLAILYDLYMGRLPDAIDFYQRYQALLIEPDNQVRGWLIDAQRRLERQQQASTTQ